MVLIEYFSVVLVDMTLEKLHFCTGTFGAKIGRKWATYNSQLSISLHCRCSSGTHKSSNVAKSKRQDN